MLTVDCLCEDACTGSLTHAAGATEQESLRQLTRCYSVLQRPRDMLLPDDTCKSRGTIFPCRYYKIIHLTLSLFEAAKLRIIFQTDQKS